ncbi:hypothetical protein [Lentzea sp. E54]|uniref:hypothetical protein n=1 Tax=Lentzea xerophila TaxID=3435883 RepID=UPI003DA38783
MAAAEALVQELSSEVLADLPDVAEVSQDDVRRLLVGLGFCGSAVARFAVETGRDVEQAFGHLRVGRSAHAFRRYYADLAEASGAGHPPRQAFASIVTWNAPTVVVRADGMPDTRIASAYGDGRTRTWTGTTDESNLWRLFKKIVALGAAANESLSPLISGEVEVESPEFVQRALLATELIDRMRKEMRSFTVRRPTDSGAMSVEVFMREIRQYGVPWDPGAEAPSGPHEAEWLRRDMMLGQRSPEYVDQVRRRYPQLLAGEVRGVEDAIRSPCLEQVVRQACLQRLSPGNDSSHGRRTQLLSGVLAVRAVHRAAGLCAAAHLGLARRFLFIPQRRSAPAGERADLEVTAVNNDAGITGMTESVVRRLTDRRLEPVLEDVVGRAGGGEMSEAQAALDRYARPTVTIVDRSVDF